MDDEKVVDGEVLATFCACTSASPEVAAHYLEACNYDLDRAVDFYFGHPPDQPRQQEHGGGGEAGNEHAPDAPPAYEDHAYEEDEGMQGVQGTGIGLHGSVDLSAADEDDELQRALAASLNQEAPGEGRPARRRPAAAQAGRAAAAAAPSRPPPMPQLIDDDDEELEGPDAELALMARMRDQALAAHREAAGLMEGMTNVTRGMMGPAAMADMMPSMFPGLAASGWPPASGPSQRRGHPFPPDLLSDPHAGPSGAGPAGRAAAAAARQQQQQVHGSNGGVDMDVPDGVDPHELEEARMLEAAMLGVPFEGRMPDFSARLAQPSRPVDPSVRMARGLMAETDQAYEESLAADRAKAEAAARSQAEAERVAREAREAAEAEARRVALEEKRLRDALERKARSLPAEPASDEPGTLSIMVKLPDGTRKGRRFRRADPLQAVFDFVDVELQGLPHKPGSYNLVNSYPRKSFTDGTPGKLEDQGMTADTALFLEPGKAA